jgi:hypothetical protein
MSIVPSTEFRHPFDPKPGVSARGLPGAWNWTPIRLSYQEQEVGINVMKYRLVFKGELMPGTDMDDCLEQLTQLFGKKADAVRSKLFRGKPIVVKKTSDEAVAGRFITAFEKAGAVLHVQTLGLDFTSRSENTPSKATENDQTEKDQDTEVTRLRPAMKRPEPKVLNREPELTEDDKTRQRKAVPDEDDRDSTQRRNRLNK